LSGYIFTTKAYIDNREKSVKQQYLLQMSAQYGELRPTSSWDLLASLGHPSKFQWASHLGSITLETFFAATLLVTTEEIKPNTTKANINLEHKNTITPKTKATFDPSHDLWPGNKAGALFYSSKGSYAALLPSSLQRCSHQKRPSGIKLNAQQLEKVAQ